MRDSVEDALTTFLTTGLDALFIGPYVIDRPEAITPGSLFVGLRGHIKLIARYSASGCRVYEIGSNHDPLFAHSVSKSVYDVLLGIDGTQHVSEVIAALDEEALIDLWSRRLVKLSAWPVHE